MEGSSDKIEESNKEPTETQRRAKEIEILRILQRLRDK